MWVYVISEKRLSLHATDLSLEEGPLSDLDLSQDGTEGLQFEELHFQPFAEAGADKSEADDKAEKGWLQFCFQILKIGNSMFLQWIEALGDKSVVL